MMRLGIVSAAALAACSNDKDLTCTLLADSSNCFAQQVAALAACMPMRTTPGTLSTDRKTCTFSDGVYIEFHDPLPQTDIYSAGGLMMTVYAPDGSTCGRLYYDDSSDGIVISVNQAAWSESEDANTVWMSCPSHTYQGDLDAVAACGPSVQLSPGTPYSVRITAGLIPTPLFSCR